MSNIRPKRHYEKNYRAHLVFNVPRQKTRADNSIKLPALLMCLVIFKDGLLCQGCNFLCAQSLVVDTNIIDQA
jgi:hypothetical protein